MSIYPIAHIQFCNDLEKICNEIKKARSDV